MRTRAVAAVVVAGVAVAAVLLTPPLRKRVFGLLSLSGDGLTEEDREYQRQLAVYVADTLQEQETALKVRAGVATSPPPAASGGAVLCWIHN